ncbi:MAG: CCA tRNA nucleotidyltransferase [Clostridiales bacterium]|jgi:tRNA nucleotidyltransferase (CCA-adding enzyme)|nr:CCA tRNA nucleotidyltransferase [Clostridiales bacterium]
MFAIPQNVELIISVLESVGHEAFIVGGCVRDIVRGAAPKDWDITTSAVPSEVKALFSRTFDTGIKHGTITVLLQKERYEVTTYRIDGEYLDNRRPSSVTFANKIEEDLSRRDFTINAIAFNPSKGFVDPFGGCGHIERGVIKCVGDSEIRFSEDALRMLRAIRFAAELGFSVDSDTLGAIAKLKENLSNISAERIREELTKLLCGAYPDALELLESTGLMYFALRERDYCGDLRSVVSQLALCPQDEHMRLALFFSHMDCEKILLNLKFDNKTQKVVSLFVKYLAVPISHDRYEIKKLLRVFSHNEFEKLLDLKILGGEPRELIAQISEEARDIFAKSECFTLRCLAVNGDDLADAGIPRGKIMGDALEKLLDAVMRDPSLNCKEKLLCLL